MKVLVVTSSFPRFPGDASGVFILGLCKELQKLGIRLTVVSPHDHGCPRHEVWGGIEIFRFPYFYPSKLQRLCYGAGILKNIKESTLALIQLPFFIAAELFCAFHIVRKTRFDLVHVHWSIPQGCIGLLLKKLHKIPYVVSLHGSDVYGLQAPLLRRLNRTVILRADACTANSRPTADAARRIGRRDGIHVVPMGVDIDFFKKSVGLEMRQRGNGKQEKVVLYAGRLIDVKGVDYLIKAFPAVLEKQKNAKLLVVGSGPRKEDLVKLSQSLHLQGRVVFHDAVSQEKLVHYYSMADVFVLPSAVTPEGETEGLGVVLLEAMACGVPVIGTRAGGISDIVRHGETGVLAREKDPQDIASKINEVLMDEALRGRLVERGMDFVGENFSWEIVAGKFLDVYRALMDAVERQI